MKAIRKLLISDLKQFFRDRTAVFFTFAFPLLFMIVFGFVFSGSQDISYNVALIDEDNTAVSGQIAGAIRQISIFDFQQGSLDDELAALKQGDISAVILIPQGTEAAINAGNTAGVKVYYDPFQTSSAQIILSVLTEATNEINRQLTQEPILISLAPESVQTHNLRNIDYLVPGILAMSIMFLGLFGSLTMVERKEKKVLKRFGATPVSRTTLISSQVLYRLVLAIIQTFIIIAIAFFAFDVTILGNWLLLFGIVLLGALTFISLGYFIVSRARTAEGAIPIVQLVQFPMLFLSGIFFPIEFIPDAVRPIVLALPLTYLGDALRQVMVEATPLYPIWLDAAVLAGWLVGCMVLAIRLFKWE